MRLPKQTLSLTLLPPAALWAEEKRCLTLAPAQRHRSLSRRLTRPLRLTRHARLYISETPTLTLTLTPNPKQARPPVHLRDPNPNPNPNP